VKAKTVSVDRVFAIAALLAFVIVVAGYASPTSYSSVVLVDVGGVMSSILAVCGAVLVLRFPETDLFRRHRMLFGAWCLAILGALAWFLRL